jgi:bifunctional non-homologous end joining protein LigD
VNFTHVDKIMFPDAGLTKGDLLNYYARISSHLLPHLKDRPITVERLPDGINGPRFWQKNTPPYYPSWIKRIELPTESGKRVQYSLVNDLDTLLFFVNQGAITFHVYMSRIRKLDRPDYVLFDLDPSASTFANVVTIAKKIHETLKKAKIDCYAKTSGKSGLHVLVPWLGHTPYDEAREWALHIANEVCAALPKIATTERSIAARGKRVYVDVMQNALGKHAVPPYVIRTIPEATVSTPLEWRELTARLNPKKFTVATTLKRFARRKDPLAELVP